MVKAAASPAALPENEPTELPRDENSHFFSPLYGPERQAAPLLVMLVALPRHGAAPSALQRGGTQTKAHGGAGCRALSC